MAADHGLWAMLCSNSVQEVGGHGAGVRRLPRLESRIPFIHFFDGFRTSHEVGKILPISDADHPARCSTHKFIIDYRQPGAELGPAVIRGTAQNPDVFFQAPRACNKFYEAVPGIVPERDGSFCRADGPRVSLGSTITERRMRARDRDHGSGAEAAEEAINLLNKQGEKIAWSRCGSFRPFDSSAFLKALPGHREVNRRAPIATKGRAGWASHSIRHSYRAS